MRRYFSRSLIPIADKRIVDCKIINEAFDLHISRLYENAYLDSFRRFHPLFATSMEKLRVLMVSVADLSYRSNSESSDDSAPSILSHFQNEAGVLAEHVVASVKSTKCSS